MEGEGRVGLAFGVVGGLGCGVTPRGAGDGGAGDGEGDGEGQRLLGGTAGPPGVGWIMGGCVGGMCVGGRAGTEGGA